MLQVFNISATERMSQTGKSGSALGPWNEASSMRSNTSVQSSPLPKHPTEVNSTLMVTTISTIVTPKGGTLPQVPDMGDSSSLLVVNTPTDTITTMTTTTYETLAPVLSIDAMSEITAGVQALNILPKQPKPETDPTLLFERILSDIRSSLDIVMSADHLDAIAIIEWEESDYQAAVSMAILGAVEKHNLTDLVEWKFERRLENKNPYKKKDQEHRTYDQRIDLYFKFLTPNHVFIVELKYTPLSYIRFPIIYTKLIGNTKTKYFNTTYMMLLDMSSPDKSVNKEIYNFSITYKYVSDDKSPISLKADELFEWNMKQTMLTAESNMDIISQHIISQNSKSKTNIVSSGNLTFYLTFLLLAHNGGRQSMWNMIINAASQVHGYGKDLQVEYTNNKEKTNPLKINSYVLCGIWRHNMLFKHSEGTTDKKSTVDFLGNY